MSDKAQEVSNRNFRDAVVEGNYQVSKPMMFHMSHFDSESGAQLVPELKPVGVIDAQGILTRVRFQNFIGDDEDVLSHSETLPNTRIYQGSQDGFQLAMNKLHSDSAISSFRCISVPVQDKKFMASIPAGCHKIGMQVRVVEGSLNGHAYARFKPRDASSERAFIILPSNQNQELFSQVNKGMGQIILEEVPFGRSSAKDSELVRTKLA
ncbi:uncharacterized protein FTJAE_4250 [Fusarium tjaetaba]|uniref:Uncharacterized protein n=1 Tax=Fusarium tjaetaba TaxID=1567544 RepID=A0A8H5RWK7_9HYPO|nr:uncharacterized protein FTJAE_4250 [Fusarium tjaetaba]KAF5641068.1 hypothetical protein FTJAE_4250 [Fusarium tjaetaba]